MTPFFCGEAKPEMARFKATNVSACTERQKRNVAFVVRQSIQDVSEIALTPKAKGGRMPVDTGFLRRNSFVAGLNGSAGLSGPIAYVAVLASFKIGDAFVAGRTAEYALRVERGFLGEDKLGRTYNVNGKFFIESAVMQWPDINDANARRIKG